MSDLSLIDVFSGIGGLSLGFEKSGASRVSLAGIEHSTSIIREVFKRVHPAANTDFCDVTELSGRNLVRRLSLVRGQLDVLVGGPPCQAFSMAGKRQGIPRRKREAPRIISCDSSKSCGRVHS